LIDKPDMKKRQRPQEQPSQETILDLLTTIAATYLTQQDVERWASARMSAWYRQLRTCTVGEMRDAWGTWQTENVTAPTLDAFMRHVQRARQRATQTPGEPCDDCRSNPGIRIVLVLVHGERVIPGAKPGEPAFELHDTVVEYACACSCDAARKYRNYPGYGEVERRWRERGHQVRVTCAGLRAGVLERELLGMPPPAPVPMASPEEMARDMREPPRRDWNEREADWETGEASV